MLVRCPSRQTVHVIGSLSRVKLLTLWGGQLLMRSHSPTRLASAADRSLASRYLILSRVKFSGRFGAEIGWGR